MSIPNIIADFSTILALKVSAGATTATLVSATDSQGVALPIGTYGFTIDRKNSNKEYITASLNGTALTNVKTVAVGTGVATSGFAKNHRRSAEVIISDFVVIKRFQDIFESGYDTPITPTTDYQLATKKYVDDLAFGGATTTDALTVAGNAGEAVSAGDVLYFKAADGYWWKADADTAATVENVMLGIAQGSGTATNPITSGILIRGLDSNQSGGTIGNFGYISNTPGAVSTTAGTNSKILGQFQSSTVFIFNPEFYIPINLAGVGGGDFGTPSGSNKYITQNYNSSPTGLPVIQTYTSSTTWTKPAGLKYIVVEVQAAGGGGGNSSTSTTSSSGYAGAGGGGGGYAKKLIASATVGATETVTVGAGGGGNTNGGNSSFGGYVTTTGGTAGGTDNGGTGGAGSLGDINISGGDGGMKITEATSSSARYTNGAGGGSHLGGAGKQSSYSNDSGGLPGISYGGGGNGGVAGSGGGNGAHGIVIVTEYYS